MWTLVLLIAGWVLLRAATWQPGAPDHTRKPQVAAPVTHAPADGTMVAAAMAGPMLAALPGPMPELPPDIRAGLSPEVADQVARELPRELAHQLAIETAREMAKAMAPGLAQRLLHERGLDRLVQARVQASVQVSGQSGPARPGGAGYAVRKAPPRRGPAPSAVRVRQSAAAVGIPLDAAGYQSFRLAEGHPVEPAGAAAAATPAVPNPRKGSWLAMLPELLLHPGRVRQTLAQNGRSINPSPRFSADAWFLQRGGSYASTSPTAPLIAGTAGYGGSQSGAVLRYRLFLADPHRLSVFLRATSATNTPDREATLGLSARPFGSIPIVLQAEARLQNDGTASRLRPAVQAISQFPPISLPLGLRGEAYAAGGYVGGRGATPFYDAAGVVDHHLFGIGQSGTGGHADVRIGAGAWAGGQKGVGRVDVGPRASVSFRVRRIGVRAAVDYRARVAGHAAPGSGPALTLSAGF